MPLVRGYSDKTRSRNIARLRREGYPPKQAAAIAYRIQREEAAKHNPSTTGWIIFGVGAATLVGVGLYFLSRPAAAASGAADKSPAPGGHLTAANLTPSHWLPPRDRAAALTKNLYVPPPFVFGQQPAPYNPGNKNLGDPNDPNSPAYACIQAYNMQHRGTPLNKREQYVAAVWGTKCVNAGGKPNW